MVDKLPVLQQYSCATLDPETCYPVNWTQPRRSNNAEMTENRQDHRLTWPELLTVAVPISGEKLPVLWCNSVRTVFAYREKERERRTDRQKDERFWIGQCTGGGGWGINKEHLGLGWTGRLLFAGSTLAWHLTQILPSLYRRREEGGRGPGGRGKLPEGSREPKMFYTKNVDITDKIQHWELHEIYLQNILQYFISDE